MAVSNEILFAKKLEEIKNTASEQGNMVYEEQVIECFKELNLDDDKLQMVFDYLVKHKVGIGKPVDVDEYLTDEEKNYLDEYLEELKALPKYSDGQKKAFVMSAMAGDAEAFKNLTLCFLKNVVDIAKIYCGQGVLMEDLIGEGNVALSFVATMLGSLEKPEEADGFITSHIMEAMEELIDENAENEKTGMKVLTKVNKVADKARELSEELGKKVTVAELAEETKLSEKYIREAMKMSGYRIEDIEDGNGEA